MFVMYYTNLKHFDPPNSLNIYTCYAPFSHGNIKVALLTFETYSKR
jgi:hypothetical protein